MFVSLPVRALSKSLGSTRPDIVRTSFTAFPLSFFPVCIIRRQQPAKNAVSLTDPTPRTLDLAHLTYGPDRQGCSEDSGSPGWQTALFRWPMQGAGVSAIHFEGHCEDMPFC
ncbi:hypothetical protein FALCPG4_000271 [Fusarium falciforme]